MKLTAIHHNPHSDLRLTYAACDPQGNMLPLPSLPFVLILRAGVGEPFRVSHDPGAGHWHHCRASVSSEWAIDVFVPANSLGTGALTAELHFTVADPAWPGGQRRVCDRRVLDICLDVNAHPDVTEAQVEAVIPMAVVTAYETARAAGFGGTAEEYYAGLSLLPALSDAVSDLAAAKAEVAAALRLHGVGVADTASLHDMADAVAHLRPAVPSQPGVVAHDWNGLPVPDLLNILRNNRRPADYPYSWAVRTPQSEVLLTGADAYLCSDGFFTCESGATHRFTDGTDSEHCIVYYHVSPRYMVANTIGAVTGVCVLNGIPGYALDNRTGFMTSGAVHSYTTDLPDEGEDTAISLEAQGIAEVYLRGVRSITGRSRLSVNGFYAGAVVLPDLERVDLISNNESVLRLGQTRVISLRNLREFGQGVLDNATQTESLSLPALRRSSGYIAHNCAALTELNLPALTEMSGGGVLAYNCAALTELNLPALENLLYGKCSQGCTSLRVISLPKLQIINGYNSAIANNCPVLESIDLPALREMYNGNVAYNCPGIRRISLPVAEKLGTPRGDTGIISATTLDHDVDIYAPAVRSGRGESNQLGHVVCSMSGTGHVHLWLGSQQDCKLELAASYHHGTDDLICHLHVAPGFRSSLPYAYTFAGTTRDELLGLIGNLADNNGHDPHSIKLGATLLALLTDDEIALATAKNYTLS